MQYGRSLVEPRETDQGKCDVRQIGKYRLDWLYPDLCRICGQTSG